MKISIKKFDIAQARAGKTLEELKIPRSTIANIKTGKEVLPTTVHNLAHALRCDVTDLIED